MLGENALTRVLCERGYSSDYMSVPAQKEKPARSRRVVRMIGALFIVLLIIAAALAGFWQFMKQREHQARAQWKGQALARLAELSITNEEILRELDDLKGGPTPSLDFGWTHENVLLMTNGEYIVYAHRHGANNGFVDHLFLGHGSDGRWLYSTFHFCNSMAAVQGDAPPGSIDEFAERYSARQFDGKSDECLQRTYPPAR
jgi:cell division protein FtsB